jgi:hypothetical protein
LSVAISYEQISRSALNLRSIHGAEAALLAFLVHDDCQPINLKGQRFQGMSKAH